jgi:hypothetical protein
MRIGWFPVTFPKRDPKTPKELMMDVLNGWSDGVGHGPEEETDPSDCSGLNALCEGDF